MLFAARGRKTLVVAAGATVLFAFPSLPFFVGEESSSCSEELSSFLLFFALPDLVFLGVVERPFDIGVFLPRSGL